jgi:hypothetical protein
MSLRNLMLYIVLMLCLPLVVPAEDIVSSWLKPVDGLGGGRRSGDPVSR